MTTSHSTAFAEHLFILEFPTRFNARNCKQVYLTKNYRSHPDIVDFYNRWMELADWQAKDRSYRFPKIIEAESNDRAKRPVVFKVSGADGDNKWAQGFGCLPQQVAK